MLRSTVRRWRPLTAPKHRSPCVIQTSGSLPTTTAIKPPVWLAMPLTGVDPNTTDTSLPAVLSANEAILNGIHNSGLPWWATIVATTFALRSTLTLPIAVYQQRSLGKMIELAPMITSWGETLKVHVAKESKFGTYDYKQYQSELQKQYRKKVNEIYAQHGCARWKLLVLPWVQIPLFISMSLTLRHMTAYPLPWFGQLQELPTEGFTQGGLLWFTDLTATDSTAILPFLIAAGNLLNVELNAWFTRGQRTRSQKIWTNVFRCLSVAFFPIAAQAPTSLGLYWVTSSWYSVIQNVTFRIPAVRKRLGMPLLPKKVGPPVTD